MNIDLSLLVFCLGPLEDFQHPSHSPLAAPTQVSPVSEQVVVIVAADSPTPTGLGPVHTGGVNGTAMDHRTGHPGWRRKCSEDNRPDFPAPPLPLTLPLDV